MSDSYKFATGNVTVSHKARTEIPMLDLIKAIVRHGHGDWGDLDEYEWKQNDYALEVGGRLQSRYKSCEGKPFWIITAWDRSTTTILLPIEY